MQLQLKKFNMKMIKDDEVVVFIGKRNTGKSFLTKDMLYYKKHLPVQLVNKHQRLYKIKRYLL